MIIQKLAKIRALALQQNDSDLYTSMMGCDFNKKSEIVEMMDRLKEKGYELSIGTPSDSLSIDKDRVKIDFSELKITVKKTVMEV